MSWDRDTDAPTALTVVQRAEIFVLPDVLEMMSQKEAVSLSLSLIRVVRLIRYIQLATG
jgi:hypothetical protein